MSFVRTYNLEHVILHEHSYYVVSQFKSDRKEHLAAAPNVMNGSPASLSTSFELQAIQCGYADTNRYLTEHQLACHYIAQETGQGHSYSIWRKAHDEPLSADDPIAFDEQFIVSRLLSYCNLGIEDEQLQATFADRLPEVALAFVRLARPWLSKPQFDRTVGPEDLEEMRKLRTEYPSESSVSSEHQTPPEDHPEILPVSPLPNPARGVALASTSIDTPPFDVEDSSDQSSQEPSVFLG
jgi:hypothetical protein